MGRHVEKNAPKIHALPLIPEQQLNGAPSRDTLLPQGIVQLALLILRCTADCHCHQNELRRSGQAPVDHLRKILAQSWWGETRVIKSEKQGFILASSENLFPGKFVYPEFAKEPMVWNFHLGVCAVDLCKYRPMHIIVIVIGLSVTLILAHLRGPDPVTGED